MNTRFALVARGILLVLLAAGVAACSSSSPTAEEATMPDFQGTYAISGSYDGRTGDSGVSGSIVVSEQTDDEATVSVSLTVRDNGNLSFALNADVPDWGATSGPVLAQLATDGTFSVTFRGREVIPDIDPSDCCAYTFALSGRLSGTAITGRWTLTRDMPSYDSGAFSAAR